MALTTQQISERLLKKSQGVVDSNFPLTTRGILEEAISTYSAINPNDIWIQAGNIPSTAPVLGNSETLGVVKFYDKLELEITDAGTAVSFKSPTNELQDAITTKFGFSYKYKVFSTDGLTEIFKGNYILDAEAGILTFYDINLAETTINAANPPKITFYKYVGTKGIEMPNITGLVVKDPVRVATISGDTLSNYSNSLSGYTTLPVSVDGVTSFTQGDRILVKNQVNTIQNGVFQVSGTTLVRALDCNGSINGVVSVNNYVFVVSGVTNLASAWVLSKSNATDPNNINPGGNTQEWKFFTVTLEYTTDGLGLILDNGEFRIQLDETSLPEGSGLYKSASGLRITTTILNQISGNTTNISALSAYTYSQISGLTQETVNLQNQINTLTGQTVDLSASAGSGLTYTTIDKKINVNVDDTTVKIINNQLRSTLSYIQFDTGTTVASGTTGPTTIILDHTPVGEMFVYVNGVEYLVSHLADNSAPQQPFYFQDLPVNVISGATLYFDATRAGFGLDSGADLLFIKYFFFRAS